MINQESRYMASTTHSRHSVGNVSASGVAPETSGANVRTKTKAEPEMPEKPVKPRMAVFGGAFNPIHNGHLFIAGCLLRLQLTDEVLFVPACNPPHKLKADLAPDPDRLAMLELIAANHPQFAVSDIELQRGEEPSYTFDTMETFRRVFNEYELSFVMGMDSLRDLYGWYRAGELVNRFEFIILPRPGARVPSHAELNPHFGPRNARKLLNSIIDLPETPVAATVVRQHARNQQCLAGLVDSAVENYILKHQLYQKADANESSEE